MDQSNSPPKRLRNKHKRKQKAAVSSAKPSSLSRSDLESLRNFCDQINYEEISFESWQQKHSNLDLRVPIWISTALARDGGEALVKFSRTTTNRQLGAKPIKQSVSVSIKIPAGTREGTSFIIEGSGDQDSEKVGNLIVIINLKST